MYDTYVKISIIIPSYNYGRFLPQTIANLKAQSYQNWEAILVDDGSSDNTPEIVKGLIADDDRFHYIAIENSGNAAARNVGLDNASGDYIQFLDADDQLSADKLSLQAKELSSLPENAISYTRNTYFDDGIPDIHYPDFFKKGQKWMPEIDGAGFEIMKILVQANFAVISSPVISRRFIDRHQIRFPEFLDNKVDWYFWLDCVLHGASLHFLDDSDAATHIRLHDKSITASYHALNFGEIIFRNRIKGLIEKASISVETKSKLLSLNKSFRKHFLRNMVYGASPRDFYLFSQLRKNLGLGIAAKYYFKNLNFLRKNQRSK
ncbi:glycosyltransferase family 2 protein [Algoriphagus sp. NG3]|uniref:glycosyltransferase family 2 protein n=1 Tax=Algoriphagus sp. NG3 TaxID=3097546 RepID=UPI002A821202|nr:glycosyltransferase family 2 protein [Algoriphagus sp. NG3]WPR76165.1 glycosyltransferase family 2 protein [Algoriphagus sp. NG3]